MMYMFSSAYCYYGHSNQRLRCLEHRKQALCAKLQRKGLCPGMKCNACIGSNCRTYRYFTGLMTR